MHLVILEHHIGNVHAGVHCLMDAYSIATGVTADIE
jgi:hypothetical protein